MGNVNQDVVKRLNAIGKSIFVVYFHVFKSDDDPVSKLPKHFTLGSRRSRTSKARSIFRDKLEIEALEFIIDSKRLDPETLEQAKQIYNSLKK